MMENLSGAVVAITGASSGIGAAAAEALVQDGAQVVLGARRQDRLSDIVERLGKESACAITMDVRIPDDSRRLVTAAIERFGRLTAFVANAGIGMFGGITANTDADIAAMIDVNFSGTVWGARAAVPALEANGGGDIVIISSVAAMRGGANDAVYSATKAAQIGLAGSMDRELWTKRIRVSSICPAAVNTPFFAVGQGRKETDSWLENVLQPTDIAHAIRTILLQPRHLRTTQWTMWAMSESS